MENIRTWYKSEFSTDELADEIHPEATFKQLETNIPNVYDYLDVYDSLIRERVFTELAVRMNVDYEVIYKMWLDLP
jgi:hypothetical protein